MATKRVPGYFCEGCGQKVDRWAVSCPQCAKIFDSIKCPKCTFSGRAADFSNGCPICGFISEEQKSRLKLEQKKTKAHIIPDRYYLLGITMLATLVIVLAVVLVYIST